MESNNRIILGLMRIDKLSTEELYSLIKGALSLGVSSFDVSDIYLNGEAERKLGRVLSLHPELRKEMFIQTKCGIIRPMEGKTRMDLSYSHIKEACDASLKRMNLSYIDSFLLHRVDIFMEAEEISKAIDELFQEGKIHHFGVSNMDGEICEYLLSCLHHPIELDQLQVSLGQPSLISQTFNINFPEQKPNLSDGLFFYLKRKHIRLQCWSPYQIGFFEGSIFDKKRLPRLNEKSEELSRKYDSTPCGIATAFLTMLTKDCQVVVGTTSLDHLRESVEGSKIILSRQDWYDLYVSTGNLLP